jgi:hypothetical protein
VAERPAEEAKSLPQVAQELWTMVVDYFKQETIEPVRGLGNFLVFGIAGAFVFGIGLVLILLAGLRALQVETGDTFDENLSWVPYLIVLVAALLLAGLAAWRIGRKKGVS